MQKGGRSNRCCWGRGGRGAPGLRGKELHGALETALAYSTSVHERFHVVHSIGNKTKRGLGLMTMIHKKTPLDFASAIAKGHAWRR